MEWFLEFLPSLLAVEGTVRATVLTFQEFSQKFCIESVVVYDQNALPGDAPLASVRIEVDIDISGPKIVVLNFRYVLR